MTFGAERHADADFPNASASPDASDSLQPPASPQFPCDVLLHEPNAGSRYSRTRSPGPDPRRPESQSRYPGPRCASEARPRELPSRSSALSSVLAGFDRCGRRSPQGRHGLVRSKCRPSAVPSARANRKSRLREYLNGAEKGRAVELMLEPGAEAQKDYTKIN